MRACGRRWPCAPAARQQASIGAAVCPHARRMYVRTAAISVSFSRSPCAGMRPIAPFLPMQQHANRHAWRANHARRTRDIRRRTRLLASVGAVTSFADVLVDFLPGRESSSDRRRSALQRRAQRRLCRANRFAPSPSRRDRRAHLFRQRRRSSAGSRESVTDGPPARAGGAGGS